MAVPNLITTGEQTVTATGAITGTLDTSTLSGEYRIRGRIRGLSGSQSIRIAIEDTANASAFSEATTVAEKDIKGAPNPEGVEVDFGAPRDFPDIRFGATNNKLRANCTAITSSTSALVEVWLEQ
jgi:hypothetical protein